MVLIREMVSNHLFLLIGDESTMDAQTMICMRCEAYNNERECGINSCILSKEKLQGFNCKLQRYYANRR